MKKFVAHFITNDYGVQTHAVIAASADAAKKKAACWAKKATGWGDVPILVETFTKTKLDALKAGCNASHRVLENLWHTYAYCPPAHMPNWKSSLCERMIGWQLGVFLAQRNMFDALTQNGAIGQFGA